MYHCIIVGSGIAAYQLAKNLNKEKRVLLITKSKKEMNNSYRAQGGIAAVVTNDDSPTLHFEDTIRAGCSFHNEEEVMALVQNGPKLIQSLREEGVFFDLNDEEEILLGMEGAHSRKRIVHCGGDATGRYVMDHLQTTISSNVDIIENQFVYELIICPTTKNCIGIKSKDAEGKKHYYFANKVVLATGGIGGLYTFTSNESSIVGDGLALAYRAGADVVDMEFIQFHPTLLYVDGEARGLISEAVRGEGATLIKYNGESLMEKKHHLSDLAPRHIVAKAIYEERLVGNEVFLDISMIQHFERKFPTITALCEENGISLQDGKLPIAPGCHFLMGGIVVNSVGETPVKGLYAVGETAATGVHGANRLASNSLLEGLYYGVKIAKHMNGMKEEILQRRHVESEKLHKQRLNFPTKKEVQEKMMRYAGIIRTRSELIQLSEWISQYDQIDDSLDVYETEEIQLLFMLQVAKLIVSAALTRNESRGAHHRADFSVSSEKWQTIHLVHSQKGIEKRKLYEHHQVKVNA